SNGQTQTLRRAPHPGIAHSSPARPGDGGNLPRDTHNPASDKTGRRDRIPEMAIPEIVPAQDWQIARDHLLTMEK
ncbi:MAG: hypothetical protein QOI16_1983, partial [Pseudonocardiales bacterium]|nr:hypothetical protein [Pseudonocardiales bacterium]